MPRETDQKVPKEFWDIPKDDKEAKTRFMEHRFGKGAYAKKNDAGKWVVFMWGDKQSDGAKKEFQEGDFPDQRERFAEPEPEYRRSGNQPKQIVVDLGNLEVGDGLEINITVRKTGDVVSSTSAASGFDDDDDLVPF